MKDIVFAPPTLPKFSKLIFFLLIFFIPQQFGPHFWPYFSFVNGIRVDYLSPALYVSDVLILLLFFSSCKKVLSETRVIKFFGKKSTFLFFVFLSIPLLYGYSTPAILFGVLKIIEFLYVGLYVVTSITKKDVPTIIEVFSAAAVIQAFLVIYQFFNQGSVNGLFYFLGERHYSLSSIGIAAMNTSQGLVVRPYGTFPHPNVLAFYLFTATAFLCYYIVKLKILRYRLLSLFSLIIIQSALFLTFSRTSIICNILFFSYLLFLFIHQKKKVSKKIMSLGIISIILLGVYAASFNIRFLNFSNIWKDYVMRQDLSVIGLNAIREFPLGLGMNNFYYYEGSLQQHFSSTYLQPIHNIFLLLASSIGIICTLLFAYFLGVIFLTLKHAVKRGEGLTISRVLLVLFLSVIFVGLFDHFFITIQQGQLLLVLILGLSLNKKL